MVFYNWPTGFQQVELRYTCMDPGMVKILYDFV